MNTLLQHGVHAPNVPFDQYGRFPVGGTRTATALWYRLGLSRARWIKLLATDHTPENAQDSMNAGMGVLVRVKGEGAVYHRDLLDTIRAYTGKAQILEVGNEPSLDEQALWTHAWYIEKLLTEGHAEARRSGFKLCVGGWRADALPPNPRTPLGSRLISLYKEFEVIGVHCYDAWDLQSEGARAHLRSWMDAFPGKALAITEYGIAAKALAPSDKAARYAAFVKALPPPVEAAFAFILGGTAEFASFTAGGYEPNGENSYWLDDRAWEHLGQMLD